MLRFEGQLFPRRSAPEGNVWWVGGNGARLVDGIRVRGAKDPRGYVVNLRRAHSPVISASRNELNGFDQEVVYRELADAAEELTRNDGLPMEWLWQLVEDDARLAVLVVDRLLSGGSLVALEEEYTGPGRQATLHPLSGVGCLPFDAIAKGLWRLRENRLSRDEFFLYWRWRMRAPDQQTGAGVDFPAGFPRPSGLDAVLFRRGPGATWSPEWAALGAAASSGLSLRTMVRALRRYAVAGVPVPAADDIRALDAMPCPPVMANLCLGYAEAGRLPYMSADGRGRADETVRHHPIAHAPLLLEAVRSGNTLGAMTGVVRLLRSIVPGIPEPPDPGDLERHVLTPTERALLFGQSPGGRPRLPRQVTPLVAAYLAAQHRLHHEKGHDPVARRFARYGYEVTDGGNTTDLSPDELAFLAAGPGATATWLGAGGIDARRLIRLAAENTADDCDVAATAAKAADLAGRFGLAMRLDESARSALFPLRAPSWWGRLPQDDSGSSGAPYNAWTVLAAASHDPEAPVDLAEVQALVDAGVAQAAAADAVRRWVQEPIVRHPFYLCRDFERPYSSATRNRWAGPARFRRSSGTVDTAFVFGAAANSDYTLRQMWSVLQAEAGAIRVAPLPEECRPLRPDRAVFSALCFTGSSVWRPEITLGMVAEYARAAELDLATAAANLRAYEPLGAPAVPGDPALDGEPFDAYNPDVERLLLFDPLAEGRLTPLALTITAVRLGLGLRSAYGALAPYARFGLDLACPEPGDDAHAPDWRDVVILTRQLTGAEPALSGEVGAGHVELAAEETDLTADQVRTRLAYYAPLFGLTVPVPPYEGSEGGRA